MKKTALVFLLILSIILTSCKFISFEEYEIPPYDGAFTWTKVIVEAQWSDRLDHAAVAYKNKLWVFGGYDPGQMTDDPYMEDVWNSSDGKNWELVQANAPWKGRRGHTVTVFDDGSGEAMFLTGGFSVDEDTGYRQYNNDIWKSTDGIGWELIKKTLIPKPDSLNNWFPRMNHSVVVAEHGGKKYLYLIGGSSMVGDVSAHYSMKYFNDVWRSTDGINWEDMHSEDYGIRSGHAAAVDPETGTIYVQGGIYGVMFENKDNQNLPMPNWLCLWSTVDGTHWTAENVTDGFYTGVLFRAEHQMAFYNNTLYVFPGKSNSILHFQFAPAEFVTIWKWDKGNLWSVDSNGSDTDARFAYGLVEFNHKIWILGGDTNANGPSNDVWSAEIR